jgi:hypothetical protein
MKSRQNGIPQRNEADERARGGIAPTGNDLPPHLAGIALWAAIGVNLSLRIPLRFDPIFRYESLCGWYGLEVRPAIPGDDSLFQ